MAPEVLAAGVRTFWNAGWQIHVHVNGDGGMDAVLAALEAAQAERPRFDHRFFMHHVGFHAAAQTDAHRRIGCACQRQPVLHPRTGRRLRPFRPRRGACVADGALPAALARAGHEAYRSTATS
jgi:predicted amidohydrolase YtcJ